MYVVYVMMACIREFVFMFVLCVYACGMCVCCVCMWYVCIFVCVFGVRVHACACIHVVWYVCVCMHTCVSYILAFRLSPHS